MKRFLSTCVIFSLLLVSIPVSAIPPGVPTASSGQAGIIETATNTEAAAASSTSVALVPGNTFGTFTGATIPDNPTIPSALQALETAVEGISSSSRSVTTKTGDYGVVAGELTGFVTFVNTGAGAEVNFTLPAGASGYQVDFTVTTAQYLRVTADGTETFRYLGSTSAAGGYIRSNVVGTIWTIRFTGGEWVIGPLTGTLLYDE